MSQRAPAPVCPGCGSKNVRWRKARPTDAVLNYLRFLADRLFSGSGMGASYGGTPSPSNPGPTMGTALEYGEMREVYEVEMGSKTAKAFWRCRDCGQKGQVYDNLDSFLGLTSAMGETEDYLGESGGSVHKPIGREERSD